MSGEGTVDEQALLVAWQSGAAQAGQALLRRHYAGLTRFFRSKAGEAAFELTQATFLACVEGKRALRSTTSFPAYLYSIARNLLHDHYRGKYRAKGTLARDPELAQSTIIGFDTWADRLRLQFARG